MNPVIKTFEFGQSTVTLETGRIARQASGAVLVTVDNDVSVLVTVVGAKQADPSKDFFPLSVHYQEKTYAAGKIPGGFFKREARPSEKETLTSRLIDRPIRPLFPNGFSNEVQVICTVVSTNKKIDPDIAAMLGTSAALAISGIPFKGPIGAARVGFHPETGYILNPSYEQLEASLLFKPLKSSPLWQLSLLGTGSQKQKILLCWMRFAISLARKFPRHTPSQLNLTVMLA